VIASGFLTQTSRVLERIVDIDRHTVALSGSLGRSAGVRSRDLDGFVLGLRLDMLRRIRREPGGDAALDLSRADSGIEHDGIAVLEDDRVASPGELERSELADRMWVEQLGDRKVERSAFEAVRIWGRKAEPLHRLACLDLGAITR
jgi:hypothetical protein